MNELTISSAVPPYHDRAIRVAKCYRFLASRHEGADGARYGILASVYELLGEGALEAPVCAWAQAQWADVRRPVEPSGPRRLMPALPNIDEDLAAALEQIDRWRDEASAAGGL